MKSVLRALAAISILLLVACSVTEKVGEKLTPYKIDIQQGNVVTQEMVAKLKPGMTKAQVRFVLGTPLITDAFHASRWDYVYRYQKAGKLTEERKLALFFDQELLQRVEGDVVAASPVTEEKNAPVTTGEPAKAAEQSAQGTAPTKEEKGFFGRMIEKIGF
ncbi:SmpA/OmlA [Sulfuricella denitrificans skB26]|uniref:Outer membrane protein assembly factor BamE n=1 Tax=Sulfuricella denitrificans (strain DSM 22764 / NBRC 105220 / skB26) TaxID=1163617 RepID=S6B280_SULDS|nr:outer membrane protein assembly factor BamE [Sulfuricella denitrificans]BAN34757.1 SmpA/OmlA [Sulfuricella denitrificans skB26]